MTQTIGKMDYVPFDNDYSFEVTFDLADATYTVQERHQSEKGTSFYNYLGHSISYTLPSNTDASAFAAWVNEYVWPSLIRIKEGYTSKWNGQNNVAKFTDDAKEARETLDGLFGNYTGQSNFALDGVSQVPTLDEGEGHWDAGDWLVGAQPETLKDYDITAASTEDDLDLAAEEIDGNALDMNVRLSGTRKWLEYAHYDLVSAAEDAAAGAKNSGV